MKTGTWFSRALGTLIVGTLFAAFSSRAEVQQGSAVVKTLTGTVSSVDALGFSHPLKVGDVLKPGETVKTGPASSVGLFLDQNGPAVSLESNSALRFDKLIYEKTLLGTVIDTQLDLKEGAMYGSVQKLIAGSHYEVKTPRGTATVRGTTFYIDTTLGTVYVTSGVVTVKVNVPYTDLNGSPQVAQTQIDVPAGKFVSIKTGTFQLSNLSAIFSLQNINTSDLNRLITLGQVVGRVVGNPTAVEIETLQNATQPSSGKVKITSTQPVSY